MQATIEERIGRGKELLNSVKHACMATVNEDGTPHNTPLLFLCKEDLSQVFWGSHPESLHSQNISRTGQAFMVLYDAMERGGLYMKLINAKVLDGKELEEAIAVHNKVRQSRGQDKLSIDYYSGDSPQRMWSAQPVQFWVNGTERDSNDHIIRDVRTEIKAKDLLSI
jgi:hypothetical protein